MPSLFLMPLGAIDFYGQILDWPDLMVVGLLILLEGLLSIDNALVLGLLAKRLPKEMQARALSYGLIGAFVFRVMAILLAGFLLQWTVAKLLGGGYLIFIALKHLSTQQAEHDDNKVVLDEEGQPQIVDAQTGRRLNRARENLEIEQRVPLGASMITENDYEPRGNTTISSEEGQSCNIQSYSQAAFWRTVLVIELTDIAFAVDSILAALALAGSEPSKLWVVIVGGILGVILMRFAATLFIKLLDRFPRFEISAYLLVIVIGLKLVLDWGCNSDWSFKQTPWLQKNLGSWRVPCEQFESRRRILADNYEEWLKTRWPLGVAEHDHQVEPKPASTKSFFKMPERVPHVLDFHDIRRPETITFWGLMAICFGSGFLPKNRKETAS